MSTLGAPLGDVLGSVGDHADHRTAPQPMNEEHRRGQDDNHYDNDEEAQSRITFLDGHSVTLPDLRTRHTTTA